jgi:hypothetical protein
MLSSASLWGTDYFQCNNALSISSSTSSLPQVQVVETVATTVPYHETAKFNEQITLKVSEQALEEAIGKLIDLDQIVDRLQAINDNYAPYTPN